VRTHNPERRDRLIRSGKGLEGEGKYMRDRFLRFAVPLLLIGIVSAACGGDEDTPAASGATGETGATGATGTECPADFKVGLALDVGGLGDKSFNDAANAGVQTAIDDGLVCADNVERVDTNSTGSNRGENVAGLAEAGFNIVVANGFLFSTEILGTVADFPDVDFAVTDGFTSFLFDDPDTEDVEPIPPNIADLTFKEHEGSFLVGAAAAIACDCDTIGFLGGQTDAPLIQKFEAGYVAGAQYINPDMEVLVEYVDPDPAIGFNDAVKGEALSTKMYENGAELIYHAAGASGAGLFNAAVKENKLAIGVDSDQYLTASAEQQPLILTSMLKRVDVAVYNAIKGSLDDAFVSGAQVFGLAEEGVDYSKSNTDLMTDDIIAQVDEIKALILDGTIVVPDVPEGV
jgi:basic membrane protein A